MSKTIVNGVIRDMTAKEQTERSAIEKEWSDGSKNRKLSRIKEIRLQKLQETDYLANSDVTMPDNIKTWRQSLRDLPQNNTTEEQYDALLALDDDGNLTNSIWSKP
jgi:hypothetical protein